MRPGPIAVMLTPRPRRQLTIPIAPNVAADVIMPFPVSEAEWQQFMAVLEAMKPGLVREPEAAAEE